MDHRDRAQLAQGNPDAVRVAATAGGNPLHSNGFAKHEVGALHIEYVAWRQDALLDAPADPTVPAVVDHRRSAVFGRTVRSTATAFEHVDEGRDYPPFNDAPRSGLVRR